MAIPSTTGMTQQGKAPFELKSASLPVVALLLKSTDSQAIGKALKERFADEPDFFDNDLVIFDLSAIQNEPQSLDFAGLMRTVRALKTIPVAVRNGSEQQLADARKAGLAEAPDAALSRADAAPRVEIREVIREVEVVREAPASETVIVDKPLRSGQQVYARGADLIVLAVVNFGAEVIADGHVHVYAPLRGRAIAGARGNTNARIFAQCMEAQLVSIAGVYRTAENDLPADVASKPAHVRLDGERLVVEPLNKG